jgi:hypothetical protein
MEEQEIPSVIKSSTLKQLVKMADQDLKDREWNMRLSKDNIHERLGVLRNYIDNGKDLPELPRPLDSWDRNILIAYAMHVGNVIATRTLMSDEMAKALLRSDSDDTCMKDYIPENFSYILDVRAEIGQDVRCKCDFTRCMLFSGQSKPVV